MAKSSSEKNGLKKGPWTPEEDQKLIDYIQKHGHGKWRTLPKNAGKYHFVLASYIFLALTRATSSLFIIKRFSFAFVCSQVFSLFMPLKRI